MENYNWYSGWSWLVWFGFIFIIFSSFGNWGYTYRVHRRFANDFPPKNARDILNERYARGEIEYDEYEEKKANIFKNEKVTDKS